MDLKTGYTIESIMHNADELIASGQDQATAEAIAFNMARGYWRMAHPSGGVMPEHLRQGNCAKALKAAREKAGE